MRKQHWVLLMDGIRKNAEKAKNEQAAMIAVMPANGIISIAFLIGAATLNCSLNRPSVILGRLAILSIRMVSTMLNPHSSLLCSDVLPFTPAQRLAPTRPTTVRPFPTWSRRHRMSSN